MNGYFGPFHREMQGLGNARTNHSEVNQRAFFASQALHDVALSHLDARYGSVVNGYDAVARHDAHLLRGAVYDGLNDHQRVFHDVKLHANALEVACQGLVESLCFLGVGVRRVRVQLLKHAPYGILHQLIVIHSVYIELRNGLLCQLQLEQRAELIAPEHELGIGMCRCHEHEDGK